MSPSCQVCGERSKKLERHHYAPERVFGLSTSSTFPIHLLCHDCHAGFHREEAVEARHTIAFLRWDDLTTDGRKCERTRCQSLQTRTLPYAYWEMPEDRVFHRGPICHGCFEVFSMETRRFFRLTKKVGA
jgi:hypothetical protein